ncbi:ureidoglycolate lyase [Curvibacter gracilis]|uniref:ureidoglycolate lyase n=1 Tax=Curvibacter gracilis TaxID=230310 RepID=UPI0005B83E6B|nr:ureidoglycolate lyase [Curvibacter gracilis]
MPCLPPTLLRPQPLSASAFAPFGAVLEGFGTPPAQARPINDHSYWRLDLPLNLQFEQAGGQAGLAIYRADARRFPLPVDVLERHTLASQSFIPLEGARFVVVVARPNALPGPDDVQAFISNGRQGVLLHPGTWHHALLAVDAGSFVVLERHTPAGAPIDCELSTLAETLLLSLD